MAELTDVPSLCCLPFTLDISLVCHLITGSLGPVEILDCRCFGGNPLSHTGISRHLIKPMLRCLCLGWSEGSFSVVHSCQIQFSHSLFPNAIFCSFPSLPPLLLLLSYLLLDQPMLLSSQLWIFPFHHWMCLEVKWENGFSVPVDSFTQHNWWWAYNMFRSLSWDSAGRKLNIVLLPRDHRLVDAVHTCTHTWMHTRLQNWYLQWRGTVNQER